MNVPKANNHDEFCYKGKTFEDKIVYGPVVNTIDDKVFINGQRVFPSTVQESLPLFMKDESFIFPGDVICKTVYNQGEFVYALEYMTIDRQEDDILLIDNSGMIRERADYCPDGCTAVFTKEPDFV